MWLTVVGSAFDFIQSCGMLRYMTDSSLTWGAETGGSGCTNVKNNQREFNADVGI